MKVRKIIIISIMVLYFVLGGLLTTQSVYAASNSDFVIENGVLTKYQGSGGDIVIPDEVKEIGDSVFFGCNSLTSVVIPDGVTKIGAEAFACCEKLSRVVIPDGVTEIGEDAFAYCRNLPSIVIPLGVTKIEENLFSGCENLTKVVLPDSITKIGYESFQGCKRLANITIPDGVTIIEALAFSECSKLSSITIPSSVTEFGEDAFFKTPWLNKKRAERNDHLVIINNILIEGIKAQGKITVPDGVKIIRNEAFYNSTITGIIMPNSVTQIGNSAFNCCVNLSNVTLSNAITEIGDTAFYNCKKLKEITIPKNVAEIGSSLFDRCDSLNKITILNKKINLFEVDSEGNFDTLIGSSLSSNGIRENKNSDIPLTIYGYKYSTADEFVVRMNTLQATRKTFGIKSLKFVPLNKNNTTLDKINVPASIDITKGKSRKLSIALPSALKRVTKFTENQGQVKISIAYSKECLNEWEQFFLYNMKEVSNDTIKGTERGTGYAYTTVTLPNGDKKVFATKVIVK